MKVIDGRPTCLVLGRQVDLAGETLEDEGLPSVAARMELRRLSCASFNETTQISRKRASYDSPGSMLL